MIKARCATVLAWAARAGERPQARAQSGAWHRKLLYGGLGGARAKAASREAVTRSPRVRRARVGRSASLVCGKRFPEAGQRARQVAVAVAG